MRYEFEVGDYVRIIANKSASKHPIGYVGKVLKSESFPRAEMPGLWYLVEEKEGGTYSHESELVIATKAEYEAYHKSQLPKYVKCLVGCGDFTVGKIYTFPYPVFDNGSVSMIDILNGAVWKFEPSTKEAFEAQNKPKPKFKIGDWVKVKPDAKASAAGTNMHNMIIKIGKICDGMNGKYIDDYEQSNLSVDNNKYGIYLTELVLATEAKVKQHLLAEAERRGFKVGVTYLNHDGDMYTANINPAFWHQYSLYCGSGQGLIYNDEYSKWGTIVAKDKELCGYKVTKSKDGTNRISIGCKTIFMNEMDGFLTVCEKLDITKVMSDYVKDKSITLDAIKEALK